MLRALASALLVSLCLLHEFWRASPKARGFDVDRMAIQNECSTEWHRVPRSELLYGERWNVPGVEADLD